MDVLSEPLSQDILNRIDHLLPPGANGLLQAQWPADIQFEVSRPRKSKLGDFRPPWDGAKAIITINSDLNPYAFLVTLLHELGHYYTWKTFADRVEPHGKEWQHIFRKLLLPYLVQRLFPPEITKALEHYMERTTASSCTHPPLTKALRLYDERRWMHVDELPAGARFMLKGHPNQIFSKGPKMRTRFRCKEIKTGKDYWVNAMAEVTMYQELLAD